MEAQSASGGPVAAIYDGMGNMVSMVQGATTQKTLTYQGRLLQTRNSSDVLQDRRFLVGSHFMRPSIDSTARNQVWDARGSNIISYQPDGTMDKALMWDSRGLEVFAAGAGSAPDVGFPSNFDLGASGLSATPRNNAWWAKLGRSVEGGWRPSFVVCPEGSGGDLDLPCYIFLCCDQDGCVEVDCATAGNCGPRKYDAVCGGTTDGCEVVTCYEEGVAGSCRNTGRLVCTTINYLLFYIRLSPKVCKEIDQRALLSCPGEGGVGREVGPYCLACLESQTGKDPCQGTASLRDTLCDFYTALCAAQKSFINPWPWSCNQKLATCYFGFGPECETLRACI